MPIHIRNAPTQLMKDMAYGAEYRYAHDESEGFSAGENYLPEALKDRRYYYPVERGLEVKIKEKLDYLEGLNKSAANKRYQ